jgi:hypothetical protein
MQSITLTLPWPSAELSPNARVHHMTRARAVKKAREYAWGMAQAAMGPLGIKHGSWRGPITVQYTFHPSMDRDRDDDNFAARMKAARDGIARALGVNDSGFTQLPVVFGPKAKPACVVVTVTPSEVQA